MRSRGFLFLVLAVFAAGVSAFAMRAWLEGQRTRLAAEIVPPPPPAPVLAEVLVAADTFTPGHILRPEDLRWQAWPLRALSDGYIRKGGAKSDAAEGKPAEPSAGGKGEQRSAAAKPDKPGKGDEAGKQASEEPVKENLTHGVADFVGAVVRQRIAKGEPILRDAVVLPGERGFLAAILTPGMRAVTVAVSATTGNGGFVFPGDFVDVLLTVSADAGGEKGGTRRASETMLHHVRVLAMDQRTANPENRPAVPRTATLEVTPKQAEIIALASEMGTLSFSLRGIRETDPGPVKPTYTLDTEVASVFAGAPAVKNQGAGMVQAVQLVRGDKVETLEFGGSGTKKAK